MWWNPWLPIGLIDEILSREKGVGSEFQIHLDHYEDGKDHMVLRVEREDT